MRAVTRATRTRAPQRLRCARAPPLPRPAPRTRARARARAFAGGTHKHAVGLVEDEVAAAAEAHLAALHEVDEAAGRGHDHVAAAVDLAQLVADVRAAVDDDGPHARAVAELARLLEDLARELARGRHDEAVRVGHAAAAAVGRPDGAALAHGRDGREEEAARLARARLRAGHEVAAEVPDRDAVLLHGRGARVARERCVLQQRRVQHGLLELVDGGGHVLAARLDRDVVVLVEVDAAVHVHAAEELRLQRRLLLKAPVEAHGVGALPVAAAAAAAEEALAAAAHAAAAHAAAAAAKCAAAHAAADCGRGRGEREGRAGGRGASA